LCNTSGVLNYPEAHFDMVRCGIGLYGYGNFNKKAYELKPVASLKSIVSQVFNAAAGETVGYNRGHVCRLDSKIATIPLGHADGVGRQYGNGVGAVYINHQRANIIGNVCMDMIMIDVTEVECKEGDEVVVFGPSHPAEEAAEVANTISYELITGVSQRVTRKFIK
jgi:alanine racemase